MAPADPDGPRDPTSPSLGAPPPSIPDSCGLSGLPAPGPAVGPPDSPPDPAAARPPPIALEVEEATPEFLNWLDSGVEAGTLARSLDDYRKSHPRSTASRSYPRTPESRL